MTSSKKQTQDLEGSHQIINMGNKKEITDLQDPDQHHTTGPMAGTIVITLAEIVTETIFDPTIVITGIPSRIISII